jgi:hypothetical protein
MRGACLRFTLAVKENCDETQRQLTGRADYQQPRKQRAIKRIRESDFKTNGVLNPNSDDARIASLAMGGYFNSTCTGG